MCLFLLVDVYACVRAWLHKPKEWETLSSGEFCSLVYLDAIFSY